MTDKVKSKTEILKFKGKIAWAKVYEPDQAFGSENWKVDFYPEDDKEWEKFNKSGIQKKVKTDDGEKSGVTGKCFQLVRPSFKLIKGAMVNFTGPVILDKDGKVICDYVNKETGNRVYSYDNKDKDQIERRGRPITLGNGSLVEMTVAVYDTFKGKGHRIETIKVLDLIEYHKDQTPPELSSLVSTSETRGGLDDDIPFELGGKETPEVETQKGDAPW